MKKKRGGEREGRREGERKESKEKEKKGGKRGEKSEREGGGFLLDSLIFQAAPHVQFCFKSLFPLKQ